MVYRWADTSAQLDRLAAASDEPLLSVEYADPETGASVMPTLACSAQRIRGRSLPVRHTGNAVHVVFSGHGSSVIEGQRFDWGPGDMFAVPSWAAAEHASDEQAEVFVLSDAPVLRALGLYREESLPAAQTVTSVFTPRENP
jgi:gentisate 1,2-dioxygenase